MCHGAVPVSRSVIPNCQFRSKTARLKTFTANQLDEIKDPSGLFYILPFQKVTGQSLSRAALPGSSRCFLAYFLCHVRPWQVLVS